MTVIVVFRSAKHALSRSERRLSAIRQMSRDRAPGLPQKFRCRSSPAAVRGFAPASGDGSTTRRSPASPAETRSPTRETARLAAGVQVSVGMPRQARRQQRHQSQHRPGLAQRGRHTIGKSFLQGRRFEPGKITPATNVLGRGPGIAIAGNQCMPLRGLPGGIEPGLQRNRACARSLPRE